MRLLPDHGVAVFVMANRTYAPAGAMARQTVEILGKTGALVPRELPGSPALVAARDAVAALVDRWDEADARALAADNFFLDRPLSEWRDELARLRERHGRCRAGEVEPENWLRGRFREQCDRGWIDVELTLAPTRPPRLQFLRLEPGMPPSERHGGRGLGAGFAWPRRGTPTRWRAWRPPASIASRLQAQLHAIGDHYGRVPRSGRRWPATERGRRACASCANAAASTCPFRSTMRGVWRRPASRRLPTRPAFPSVPTSRAFDPEKHAAPRSGHGCLRYVGPAGARRGGAVLLQVHRPDHGSRRRPRPGRPAPGSARLSARLLGRERRSSVTSRASGACARSWAI